MRLGETIYLEESIDRWRFVDRSNNTTSVSSYATQQDAMRAWYYHDVTFNDVEKGQGDDSSSSDALSDENENP